MPERAPEAVDGRARRGTTGEFEAILKRITPTLRSISRKLDSFSSSIDDEDLCQEALLHLWLRFCEGGLDEKTDSYLLQGCYFHLRNHIRKTQDRATLLSLSMIIDDEGSELQEVLSMNETDLLDEVEGNLQAEAVQASGMTERERHVLCLSMEGMTTREIGRLLGVSHVAVVKTKGRIKKRYEMLETGGRGMNAVGERRAASL